MGKWIALEPPYSPQVVSQEAVLVWQHEGVGEPLRYSHPKLAALVELAGGHVFVDELWLPVFRFSVDGRMRAWNLKQQTT